MSNKEQALQREQELKKELTPSPNVGEKETFTGFGSLFKIVSTTDGKKSEKIGNGMAQILIDNNTKRARLLMRNHKDLNAQLINCYILPFGELKKSNDTQYQFDAIDYAKEVSKDTYYIVFLSADTATKFKDAYMQSYLSNKKLLEESKL